MKRREEAIKRGGFGWSGSAISPPCPPQFHSKSGIHRGVTNARNTASPRWRRGLGPSHPCLVPVTAFAEPAGQDNGNTWFSCADDRRPLRVPDDRTGRRGCGRSPECDACGSDGAERMGDLAWGGLERSVLLPAVASSPWRPPRVRRSMMPGSDTKGGIQAFAAKTMKGSFQ